MKYYSDDIDAILDILERKYYITENILEKNDLLEVIINRENLKEISKLIIWIGRYKDFTSKRHATNYVIKLLRSKKNELNYK